MIFNYHIINIIYKYHYKYHLKGLIIIKKNRIDQKFI